MGGSFDPFGARDGSDSSNLASGRQAYRDLWWLKADDDAVHEAVSALSDADARAALVALLCDLRRVSSRPEEL